MGNLFVNLPMPAFNGPGTPVATDQMGRDKTCVVSGTFVGATITIEASVDGGVVFAPLATFSNGSTKEVVSAAANFMRVNVAGRSAPVPFSAVADVAANDDGALFIALPLPAFNGNGPAVAASQLGSFTTFIVGGVFPGASIQIQLSEDGVAWAPTASFTDAGPVQSKDTTAAFYRTVVAGRTVNSAFVGVSVAAGSINNSISGDNPQPPFPGPPIPNIITLYARTTGSDVTGDGSLANPFQTLQHLVRIPPINIPQGVNYVLDITGITETMPTDYVLPGWKAPDIGIVNAVIPQFFSFGAAVSIQATPRLTTLLTPADATIQPADITSQVAQTGSGLILLTVTVARAAWGANALKGKFLMGANANQNCTIIASTTTTLLLATSVALTGTLLIMEPSASIICNRTATAGTVNGGFCARNVDSLALNGLKITTPQSAAFALECGGNGSVAIQSCELESPLIMTYAIQCNRIIRNWIYGDQARFAGSWSIQFSFLDACTALQFSALGPVNGILKNAAVIGGAPVRICQGQFPGQGVVSNAPATFFVAENVQISDIVGATNDGLRFHGTRGIVRNADIRGNGRDGIRMETGSGLLELFNVRSTVANSVSAAGNGINITDGMSCKVDAATSGAVAGTQLRGTTEMKVGTGATRTWADFVSGASGRPALNEYDLVAVAGAAGTFNNSAAAPSYVSGTGTRLFQ